MNIQKIMKQAQDAQNKIAEMLSGAGLNEILTNSVSQSQFEPNENIKKQTVMLLNSQTAELDSLRSSILYTGLEVIAHNQNRKHADLRFFEFGSTYHINQGIYSQQKHLCLWLTGKTFEDSWTGKSEKYNFYHLKNLVELVLHKMGHQHFETEISEANPFTFSLSHSSTTRNIW